MRTTSVFGASVLKRIKIKDEKYQLPIVYKTNMPSKTISLNKECSKDHPYKNIPFYNRFYLKVKMPNLYLDITAITL